MFLRFGFANHGPFRDPQEISFLASRLDDLVHAPIPPRPHAKHGVLPILGMYGANAAGKSCAVSAIRQVFDLVVNSFGWSPSKPVRRKPFKLDEASASAVSRFDCDLLLDGVRYHYGFACSDARFEEEWLYAWPEGSKQLWFHRQGPEKREWYFGPGLKGERKSAAEQTRENCLLLGAAAQLDHAQLGAVHRAFVEGHPGSWEADVPKMWSRSPLFEPERRDTVRALLGAADLGIVDFGLSNEKERVKRSIRLLRENNLAEMAEGMERRLTEDGDPFRLALQHRGQGSSAFELDPEEESTGTHTLLNRLHEILQVLDRGGLLVVDELDRSLHPHLCGQLIQLFADPTVNPKGAQLLFTAHDLELMDHLRRDEVVLVDKDQEGVATLSRMSDFKILKREDMRRIYTEGRVGAVPRLGDLGRALRKVTP